MRTLTCFVVAAMLLAAAGSATAELPENYLKRWDDLAVQKRIDDGIERNRKSDVVLTIVDAAGTPLTGAEVKVAQTSHEFLFGCNLFVLGQMEEKNKAYGTLGRRPWPPYAGGSASKSRISVAVREDVFGRGQLVQKVTGLFRRNLSVEQGSQQRTPENGPLFLSIRHRSRSFPHVWLVWKAAYLTTSLA